MRFDDRVTGNLETYAKQAKIIHMEIDPAEVNKNVECDISVLGNIKEAKVDEKISLILFDELFRLDEKFEVNALMNDENKRVDLTALPFCTIDPSSAKDHDDAIYYDEKEHAIYVAIADVSYFVPQDSDLDEAAFLKSTSIYLPNKVLPKKGIAIT